MASGAALPRTVWHSSGGVLPQLSQRLAQAPSGEALATSAQLWQRLAQLWHLWALRLRPWEHDYIDSVYTNAKLIGIRGE